MAQILIVDDTKNIRKMVELTLQKAGHQTRSAEDGEEGLRLFGDGTSFDLTLVDQQMPGVTGDAFVVQARKRDPMARLMMMTAFATPELATEVIQSGALDFLRKPFSTETLRATVQVALSHPRDFAPAPSFDPDPDLPRPGEASFVAPRVSSRVNGFSFWPVRDAPDAALSADFALGRLFQVRLPAGDFRSCFVGITPHVRAQIEAGQGHALAGDDPFWDELCGHTLFAFIADKAETPPDILPVYETPGEPRRDPFRWGALFGR